MFVETGPLALKHREWLQGHGKCAVSGANHRGQLTIPSIGEGVEQLELLYVAHGNENDTHFAKTV